MRQFAAYNGEGKGQQSKAKIEAAGGTVA